MHIKVEVQHSSLAASQHPSHAAELSFCTDVRLAGCNAELLDGYLVTIESAMEAIETVPEREVRRCDKSAVHLDASSEIPLLEILGHFVVKAYADVLLPEIVLLYPSLHLSLSESRSRPLHLRSLVQGGRCNDLCILESSSVDAHLGGNHLVAAGECQNRNR